MSSFTKSLLRLTVVTFIFAMLMPVSTTRAGPPDANGCHPDHKEDCGSSGSGDRQYTLTFGAASDLTLSETGIWSESSGRFMGLNAHDVITTIDLSFFASMTGPFSSNDDGVNCFTSKSPSTATPLFAATLQQKNIRGGAKQAIGSFWFLAANIGGFDVWYILSIFGTFSNDDNWPGANTLTMTDWLMQTASGNGNAAHTACTGEGGPPFLVEMTLTLIEAP